MFSSIKIGKIAGIEIGVHWSWLLIFALITWSFAGGDGLLQDYYPDWSTGQRWVVGGIIAMIFFASILAHELSHSLVAKALGIPVNNITLFVFGGVSNLGREAKTAAEEFQIAIVGPLMSLLIAGVFAILWISLRSAAPEASGIAANLAFINAVIAAFNMLPGFPLDGGRVFRAIVWWRNRNLLRATKVAARVGEGVAFLLMAAGAIEFVRGDEISGAWIFLIGLFLRNASTQSYEQMVLQTTLGGFPVGQVARKDFTPVPPDITVEQLVHDYMLAGRGRYYPVLAGQELLGLFTLTDAQRVPREQWATTSVYKAMTPFDRLRVVEPNEDAIRVLQIMGEADINQVPVVDGRLLIGMVSRADLLRLIQIRRAAASEQ